MEFVNLLGQTEGEGMDTRSMAQTRACEIGLEEALGEISEVMSEYTLRVLRDTQSAVIYSASLLEASILRSRIRKREAAGVLAFIRLLWALVSGMSVVGIMRPVEAKELFQYIALALDALDTRCKGKAWYREMRQNIIAGVEEGEEEEDGEDEIQ